MANEKTGLVESYRKPIEIRSEGGNMALSPQSLLQHFLPGAKPYNGSNRVFEGYAPGNPSKKCYVQTEALVGMLLEAREKKINPISGMYLIPSNDPVKPATHKIKYTEGLQRARLIPGFLGINSGLLVGRSSRVPVVLNVEEPENITYVNEDKIEETHGDFVLPGDKILGAWAELYIANMPRPLRKEVSKKEFWGAGPQWDKKGGFMLCKVALDHLMRTNFPTLYSDTTSDENMVLEAQQPSGHMAEIPTFSDEQENTQAEVIEEDGEKEPSTFHPGVGYKGRIAALMPKTDKGAGRIELETDQGMLTAFFFSRPDALKESDDWGPFIGEEGLLSFVEKPDKNGNVWRHVDGFDIGEMPF